MNEFIAAVGRRRAVPVVILVALLAALAAAGFAVAAGPIGPLAILPASVVLVFVLVAFALPVQMLPATALILFAVLPLQLIPSNGVFNVARPATVVIAIWVLRRALRHRRDPDLVPHRSELRFGGRFGVLVIAALLVLWLGYATWRSNSSGTSTAWTLSFVTGALLPLLVFDARTEARLLRSAFLWTGGALAAYSVLEQLTRSSPVYDTIAKLVGVSTVSPWSVYRAEASFGHPLFAGAFFVIPAALGIGAWLLGGPARQLILGGLCAIGTVMTVSRSSILAVAIAAVAAVVAALLLRQAGSGKRIAAIIALAAVAGIATAGFGPLEARADSEESGLSAGVRGEALQVAIHGAQVSGWLGTGPATSGETGRLFSTIVIENSLLQLLISIGIPGLVLFLLLFGTAAAESLRRHDAASFAAVIGYLVAITGFNSIDAVRPMHVLLGLLLVLALNGGVDAVPRSAGRFRPPTSRATPRPVEMPEQVSA